MKKYLILITLLEVLIFSMIGCSSGNNSDNKMITPVVTNNPTAVPSVTTSPIPSAAEQPPSDADTNTAKESIRFIVLADSRGSDNGVNSEIVKSILSEVQKLSPQPEFAVMPGDLTDGSKNYEGIKGQLDYFKQIITGYYPVKFYYPGIGNHEMRAGKAGEKAFSETFDEFDAEFLDGYNRTSYYFDVGDARLFMLNSDHTGEKHKIEGDQLDWLKSNIDPEKSYHLFFLHEPPYPTGAEAGNSLDSAPEARDAFWEVVDNSNNPIVFCGHEHNYSRRLVDSSFNQKIGGKSFKYDKAVMQVISGGFGAPLYTEYTEKKNMIIPPIPQYHYTVVDMNEDGLNIQAINIDGDIIDTFEVKK